MPSPRLSTLLGCFAVGMISTLTIPNFDGLLVASIAAVIFAFMVD